MSDSEEIVLQPALLSLLLPGSAVVFLCFLFMLLLFVLLLMMQILHYLKSLNDGNYSIYSLL